MKLQRVRHDLATKQQQEWHNLLGLYGTQSFCFLFKFHINMIYTIVSPFKEKIGVEVSESLLSVQVLCATYKLDILSQATERHLTSTYCEISIIKIIFKEGKEICPQIIKEKH